MAHCNRKCVGCVEELAFDVDSEGFLHHEGHLFLGCGAVAADRHLGLAGGILMDGNAVARSGGHGRPLGPSELEDDLGVLAVERRFDGKVRGVVKVAQGVHLFVDAFKLVIGIRYATEVEHSHVYERRLAGSISTDDPETKDVGSGIDAEDGAGLHLFDDVEARVGTQHFGNYNSVRSLVVFEKGGHHARKRERGAVESVRELGLAVLVAVAEMQPVWSILCFKRNRKVKVQPKK